MKKIRELPKSEFLDILADLFNDFRILHPDNDFKEYDKLMTKKLIQKRGVYIIQNYGHRSVEDFKAAVTHGMNGAFNKDGYKIRSFLPVEWLYLWTEKNRASQPPSSQPNDQTLSPEVQARKKAYELLTDEQRKARLEKVKNEFKEQLDEGQPDRIPIGTYLKNNLFVK